MFRFDRVLYIRVLPETAETMPPPIAQLLSGKAARAAAVNKANAAKGLRLKDTEMAVRQCLKDLVRRVAMAADEDAKILRAVQNRLTYIISEVVKAANQDTLALKAAQRDEVVLSTVSHC